MRWLTFAAALLPFTAQGATIVALPEPELSRKADAIVFGTILHTETVVAPDGYVVTTGELQVYRTVRGPSVGAVITLKVPGGRLPGGLVASAAGAPTLEAGQMLFGFLEKGSDGAFRPLGLSFGLLRVRQAADGTFRASRNLDGLAMLSPSGAAAEPELYRLEDVPLEELIRRVAGHLGGLAPPVEPGFFGPGTVKP